MRSRFWLFFFMSVAVISLSIEGAKTSPLPMDPSPSTLNAQKIFALVSDLQAEDTPTLRTAIVGLRQYSDDSSISSAIQPLIDIVDGESIYDPYTRAQAIHTLGVIGTIKGNVEGKRAIEKVKQELAESGSELIRLASVDILGRTRWESVRQPLIDSERNDPCPVVRLIACKALTINTNGRYSSPSCNYQEDAQGVLASGSPDALALSESYFLGNEIYLWASERIMVPIDSLISASNDSHR